MNFSLHHHYTYKTLVNLDRYSAERHGFHLVRPSPWFLLTSISIFQFVLSLLAVFTINHKFFLVSSLKNLFLTRRLNYKNFLSFYRIHLIDFSSNNHGSQINFKYVFSAFLFLPSQYFFPEPATQVMASIIIFHHDVMFYLVFFTIFILWMLGAAIFVFSDFLEDEKKWGYSSRTTQNKFLEIFWTIVPAFVLFLIAVPFLGLLYATAAEPVYCLEVESTSGKSERLEDLSKQLPHKNTHKEALDKLNIKVRALTDLVNLNPYLNLRCSLEGAIAIDNALEQCFCGTLTVLESEEAWNRCITLIENRLREAFSIKLQDVNTLSLEQIQKEIVRLRYKLNPHLILREQSFGLLYDLKLPLPPSEIFLKSLNPAYEAFLKAKLDYYLELLRMKGAVNHSPYSHLFDDSLFKKTPRTFKK